MKFSDTTFSDLYLSTESSHSVVSPAITCVFRFVVWCVRAISETWMFMHLSLTGGENGLEREVSDVWLILVFIYRNIKKVG